MVFHIRIYCTLIRLTTSITLFLPPIIQQLSVCSVINTAILDSFGIILTYLFALKLFFFKFTYFLLNLFLLFILLEIETRAFLMLGKHSTTELHLQPVFILIDC
jgi:hypothetical protein